MATSQAHHSREIARLPTYICALVIAAGFAAPIHLHAEPHTTPEFPAALDPDWVQVPAGYSPSQAEHLKQGVSLEALGREHEAEALYSALAERAPEFSNPYWRAARALFTNAEKLPATQRAERIALLERSQLWAERGLEQDPGCAECMLFKAAALGRLATIHGVVWGAKHVSEIASLLDRGIALEPIGRDGPNNSTLANLYFARATVYRTVPEWFFLRWVVGMRGNIDQSLQDIRLARALHPTRLDYQVEHGVILLCRSQRRDRPDDARLGLQILKRASEREPQLATDVKDLRMVGVLLEDTERACEFARDGFMDIEEHKDGITR